MPQYFAWNGTCFFHWKNKGKTVSSGTSAYCQARKKLSGTFLEKVFGLVSDSCESETKDAYLWRGKNVKIVDGTSVSMPDTPENQGEYPQPSVQKKGCGFPIARILAVFSLASGALVKFAPFGRANALTKHHARLQLR